MRSRISLSAGNAPTTPITITGIVSSLIFLVLLIAFIPSGSIAHTGEDAVMPRNESPTIDGVVNEQEWNGSEVITLSVEGNDADVHFKHNGDSLYFGFNIQEGHNSALPDTRIFLDTAHDAASSPQEDDIQFYINPDNGGLVERQGDGAGWQDVEITDWTGAWDEDGSDHWSTEYNISSEKFTNFTGNETFGFCLLVYGNSPGALDTWPDGADMDDPSTWGHISFSHWTEEEEDEKPLPPPPPPTNETDPNSTANETDDDNEDDEFLTIPAFLPVLAIILAFIAIDRK